MQGSFLKEAYSRWVPLASILFLFITQCDMFMLAALCLVGGYFQSTHTAVDVAGGVNFALAS